MKLKLYSDLHLEFRNNLFDHIHFEHPDDKDTILLLAGDIAVGTGARAFVEEMCNHFKHVIMVHGNHEYYLNDVETIVKYWKDYANGGSVTVDAGPTNFHFLYNDSVIIDGVRFLGGTMWTSFNNGDIITMNAAKSSMNDYCEIKFRGETITPDFVMAEHNKFMEFLIAKFNEPFDGQTVVMTHHSPGNELRRRGIRGSTMGACYFADIEELIGNYDVACLHVHGHTHQSFDYMVNNTRVVSNPYGYWGDVTNRKFDRNLIIEI